MRPEYAAAVADLIADRRRTGGLVNEPQWSDSAVVRDQCHPFSKALVARFPHLRLEKGFCVHDDDPECPDYTEHWWCVDVDGTVVDPTEAQFFGRVHRYSPHAAGEFKARVGTCPNCGEGIFEGGGDYGGLCSEECATDYSNYISAEARRA